jgi:hypothetical protein
MGFGNAVEQGLNIIRRDKLFDVDYLSPEAINAGCIMVKSTEGLWPEVSQKIVKIVLDEVPKEAPKVTVWWYSVLIRIWMKEELFLEFVRYVHENRNSFSVETQYFLFYQLTAFRFNFQELDIHGKAEQELWQLYMEIIEEYAGKTDPELLKEIPQQERDKDVVIVIIDQYLGEQHGPTKTALDRCKTLITHLGKKFV